MALQSQMRPTGTGSGFHQTQMLTLNEPGPHQTIPLVGHIITDEDIGALQGTKLQTINLNKVVKLLTDPHSAVLYERHAHALKKVAKHYSKGFLMKDLVAVFKILNVCADRIDESDVYIEPMLNILQICSLPYLKEKSSDEMSYEQIAAESIAQLGYLMRVPCDEVRLQICETLIAFYARKPPSQEVQGHKPNSLTYNQKIVQNSDVAETLVKSLALLENDLPVRIKVLECLQILSKKSESNCDQMLCAGAAERLAARLMDHDPSGQVLFRSTDVLWNLLENGDKQAVSSQLNNRVCIGQLRDAFLHQLTAGYSHYDRQLRNDLLVIASLVAQLCPTAPFLETGFVKQLVLFATFQEVKSHHVLTKHLKLLRIPEDFELKKLIINMLVLLCHNPGALPVMSEGKLLLALFSFVKANEMPASQVPTPASEWSPAQFEELQLLAMSALASLAPRMVDDYMMCQGNTRLLLLLEWCVGPDDFGGTGNSFHGAGGRNNKKAQMRLCLRLLRAMVSCGVESVLADLTDQGAINQVIAVLASIVNRRKKQEHIVDVEMQCDMLFILSALCENDLHRKELFGAGGVDVVIAYLRTDLTLLTSGLGHHRLLLAAVDTVWCAIIGCYLTEDYFLEKEGVFLLFDLLEACPKHMHNLLLGTLLDLTENPKTIPHIATWRGKEDVSAPHLLCDIWRAEEKDMGVERDVSTGALGDTGRPLIGKLQESMGVTPLPAACPSQAIVDVSENMRAKIYAIFGKIGFIELPGLTTDDHVTLTIIEHYLDFKLGEVWTEVVDELEQESVRPITPDREAMEAISRTVIDRADHVAAVQKELLEAQNQQDLLDEQELYAEIRENYRQKEKALTNFHDFVSRTSNHRLLMAAKERQALSIDASRVQNNYTTGPNFHNTDVKDLNTTIYAGSPTMFIPGYYDPEVQGKKPPKQRPQRPNRARYSDADISSSTTMDSFYSRRRKKSAGYTPYKTTSNEGSSSYYRRRKMRAGHTPYGDTSYMDSRDSRETSSSRIGNDSSSHKRNDLWSSTSGAADSKCTSCSYCSKGSSRTFCSRHGPGIHPLHRVLSMHKLDAYTPHEYKDEAESYFKMHVSFSEGVGNAKKSRNSKITSRQPTPFQSGHEFDSSIFSSTDLSRGLSSSSDDPIYLADNEYETGQSSPMGPSTQTMLRKIQHKRLESYGNHKKQSDVPKINFDSVNTIESDTSPVNKHKNLPGIKSCKVHIQNPSASPNIDQHSLWKIQKKGLDNYTNGKQKPDVLKISFDGIEGAQLETTSSNEDENLLQVGNDQVHIQLTSAPPELNHCTKDSNYCENVSSNEYELAKFLKNVEERSQSCKACKKYEYEEHQRGSTKASMLYPYTPNIKDRGSDDSHMTHYHCVYDCHGPSSAEQIVNVIHCCHATSHLDKTGKGKRIHGCPAESHIIDENNNNVTQANEDLYHSTQEQDMGKQTEYGRGQFLKRLKQNKLNKNNSRHSRTDPVTHEEMNYNNNKCEDFYDQQWSRIVQTHLGYNVHYDEEEIASFFDSLRIDEDAYESFVGIYNFVDGDFEDEFLPSATPDADPIDVSVETPATGGGHPTVLSSALENYMPSLVLSHPTDISPGLQHQLDSLHEGNASMNSPGNEDDSPGTEESEDDHYLEPPPPFPPRLESDIDLTEDEQDYMEFGDDDIDEADLLDEEMMPNGVKYIFEPSTEQSTCANQKVKLAGLFLPLGTNRLTGVKIKTVGDVKYHAKEMYVLTDSIPPSCRLELNYKNYSFGFGIDIIEIESNKRMGGFAVSMLDASSGNLQKGIPGNNPRSLSRAQSRQKSDYKDANKGEVDKPENVSKLQSPVTMTGEMSDHDWFTFKNFLKELHSVECTDKNPTALSESLESQTSYHFSKLSEELVKDPSLFVSWWKRCKQAHQEVMPKKHFVTYEEYYNEMESLKKNFEENPNLVKHVDGAWLKKIQRREPATSNEGKPLEDNVKEDRKANWENTDHESCAHETGEFGRCGDSPSVGGANTPQGDGATSSYDLSTESLPGGGEDEDYLLPELRTCFYDPLLAYYRPISYSQHLADILRLPSPYSSSPDPYHFWRTPAHFLELITAVDLYDEEADYIGESNRLYNRAQLTEVHRLRCARIWCTMVAIQVHHWQMAEHLSCCHVSEIPTSHSEYRTPLFRYLDLRQVTDHIVGVYEVSDEPIAPGDVEAAAAAENTLMWMVDRRAVEYDLPAGVEEIDQEFKERHVTETFFRKYSEKPLTTLSSAASKFDVLYEEKGGICSLACLINARLHNDFWGQHVELLLFLLSVFGVTRGKLEMSFGPLHRDAKGRVELSAGQSEHVLSQVLYMMEWVERRFSRACEIAAGVRDVMSEVAMFSLLRDHGSDLFTFQLWQSIKTDKCKIDGETVSCELQSNITKWQGFGGFGLECLKEMSFSKVPDEWSDECLDRAFNGCSCEQEINALKDQDEPQLSGIKHFLSIAPRYIPTNMSTFLDHLKNQKFCQQSAAERTLCGSVRFAIGKQSSISALLHDIYCAESIDVPFNHHIQHILHNVEVSRSLSGPEKSGDKEDDITKESDIDSIDSGIASKSATTLATSEDAMTEKGFSYCMCSANPKEDMSSNNVIHVEYTGEGVHYNSRRTSEDTLCGSRISDDAENTGIVELSKRNSDSKVILQRSQLTTIEDMRPISSDSNLQGNTETMKALPKIAESKISDCQLLIIGHSESKYDLLENESSVSLSGVLSPHGEVESCIDTCSTAYQAGISFISTSDSSLQKSSGKQEKEEHFSDNVLVKVKQDKVVPCKVENKMANVKTDAERGGKRYEDFMNVGHPSVEYGHGDSMREEIREPKTTKEESKHGNTLTVNHAQLLKANGTIKQESHGSLAEESKCVETASKEQKWSTDCSMTLEKQEKTDFVEYYNKIKAYEKYEQSKASALHYVSQRIGEHIVVEIPKVGSIIEKDEGFEDTMVEEDEEDMTIQPYIERPTRPSQPTIQRPNGAAPQRLYTSPVDWENITGMEVDDSVICSSAKYIGHRHNKTLHFPHAKADACSAYFDKYKPVIDSGLAAYDSSPARYSYETALTEWCPPNNGGVSKITVTPLPPIKGHNGRFMRQVDGNRGESKRSSFKSNCLEGAGDKCNKGHTKQQTNGAGMQIAHVDLNLKLEQNLQNVRQAEQEENLRLNGKSFHKELKGSKLHADSSPPSSVKAESSVSDTSSVLQQLPYSEPSGTDMINAFRNRNATRKKKASTTSKANKGKPLFPPLRNTRNVSLTSNESERSLSPPAPASLPYQQEPQSLQQKAIVCIKVDNSKAISLPSITNHDIPLKERSPCYHCPKSLTNATENYGFPSSSQKSKCNSVSSLPSISTNDRSPLNKHSLSPWTSQPARNFQEGIESISIIGLAKNRTKKPIPGTVKPKLTYLHENKVPPRVSVRTTVDTRSLRQYNKPVDRQMDSTLSRLSYQHQQFKKKEEQRMRPTHGASVPTQFWPTQSTKEATSKLRKTIGNRPWYY